MKEMKSMALAIAATTAVGCSSCSGNGQSSGNGISANGIAPGKKPNILILMADQWQGKAIGCLGEVPVATPHLDSLAADGVIFTNAMSNYPVSSPARAMFMTGMYPYSNHVTANCYSGTSEYGVELDGNAVCWSDCLKKAGYATGYIGKWHLDAPYEPYVNTSNNKGIAWNEWCPPERRHGFDYWEAYGTYDMHMKPMYWSTGASRDDFHYVNEWGPSYEAGKAIEFIKEHSSAYEDDGKPFALMVSMNPPHTPYTEVPDKYLAMYENLDAGTITEDPRVKDPESYEGKFFRRDIPRYYACMTGVDEQIGRILSCLRSEGLYDDTLIIFVSDHGDFVGTMGDEHKNMYYEDAVRIPLIMTWQGRLAHRIDNESLIGIADICPTMLSMIGLGDMIPESVEAFDHSSYILDNKASLAASWQPYYKIRKNPEQKDGIRGIRDKRYTYAAEIRNGQISEEFLYDRLKDPYQTMNIAGEECDKAEQMRRILASHLTKTSDPLLPAVTGK